MTFSPFRILGAVAIMAGAARVASSFLDWTTATPALELFALAIDISLLLGVSGFYFANAARLGIAGFLAYAIAAAGIAFITGPDGVAFGVDIYGAGSSVIGVAFAALATVMLATRTPPVAAAAAWIIMVAAGVGGAAIGEADFGFRFAGALLGLGFVAAGLSLLRR